MSIKIIFSGELVPGFERDQVIKNFSRLVKLDEAAVEKKLFSGRRVVIKKVDDPAVAERYRQRLARVGVVVEVEAEPTVVGLPSVPVVEPSPPPVAPPQESEELAPTAKRRTLFKDGLVVLVILAAIAYAWIDKVLLDIEVPAVVAQSEQALASRSAIMLAHANVAKLVELQNSFLGLAGGDALIDPADGGVLAELARAGIDLQQSVDQALFALYADKSAEPGFALVLLGSFPAERVRQFVAQHFESEEVIEKGRTLLLYREQDVESCSYSPYRAIDIRPERIIISSRTEMVTLLERLERGVPSQININTWQAYRAERLFSAGLLAPELTDRAASGMVGMLLAAAKEKIAPVNTLFAGGALQSMPPGLLIDVGFNSSEQSWIEQTQSQWRRAVSNMQSEMAVTLPTLGALFDSLVIRSGPGQLLVELQLDRELRRNWGSVVQSLLGELFSFKVSSSDAGAQFQEVIDETPERFLDSYSIEQLPPFDSVNDSSFISAWQGGPFALRIDRIALTEAGRVEIHLQGEGRQLENVGRDRVAATLNITQVLDKQGASILHPEPCGAERNLKSAAFKNIVETSFFQDGESIHYKKTHVEKRLRLKHGVKLSDVGVIKGAIELDQATQLERLMIEAPFVGKLIEREGLRLQFKESGAAQVVYSLSGDRAQLLAVRALNREKKPLKNHGGSSMDALFGGGRSYRHDFRGEVAFVEVVLVQASEKKRYPVELKQLLLVSQPEFVVERAPVVLYDKKQLHKAFARSVALPPSDSGSGLGVAQAEFHHGPVNLGLYRLSVSKHFGVTGTAAIRLPLVPGLSNNLSAVELVIERVKRGDSGDEVVNYSDYIDVMRPGSNSYMKSGKAMVDSKKAYLEGSRAIRFESETEDVRPITELAGRVILRLPTVVDRVQLEQFYLGAGAESGGYRLRVVERSGEEIKLALNGERIIGLYVLNEEGGVTTRSPATLERDGEQWYATVTYTGEMDRVELLYAERVDRVVYPFKLQPR